MEAETMAAWVAKEAMAEMVAVAEEAVNMEVGVTGVEVLVPPRCER